MDDGLDKRAMYGLLALFALIGVWLMPLDRPDHRSTRFCGRFYITGYDTPGRTATGTTARIGESAVDPSVIPLGSTITIQGLWKTRAEDVGGAVLGAHIDVFVHSDAEAYRITGYRHACWQRAY